MDFNPPKMSDWGLGGVAPNSWLGFRWGCTEFSPVRDQENTPPPTGYLSSERSLREGYKFLKENSGRDNYKDRAATFYS